MDGPKFRLLTNSELASHKWYNTFKKGLVNRKKGALLNKNN